MIAEAPDRTIAPEVKPIGQIEIYEAKPIQLSNGLPLYLLDSGIQPLIAVEMHFGLPFVPGQPSALPAIAFKMVLEGTRTKKGNVLADAISYFGAFTEVSTNADRGTLVVYTLKRHFFEVLELVKEAVEESILPIEAFEKLKKTTIQSLEINKLKTSFQAGQIFRQQLFGATSRYGNINTSEDTAAITYAQVQEYYYQHIQQSAFEAILAGQVEDVEVEAMQKLFGHSSKSNLADSIVESFPETKAGAVEFEMPESKQSTIRLGRLTISIHHPDYPALKVANEVLGGYFGSRLMKNIREEKGYTYGIYSQVASNRTHAQFLVASDVKKEKTAEAIDEIKLEMHKLMQQPIDAEELETVKNYMLGTLLNSLNTPFALADKFKAIHFNGVDYAYYQHYMNMVRTISAEHIMQICQQYFQPNQLLEVVAGKR